MRTDRRFLPSLTLAIATLSLPAASVAEAGHRDIVDTAVAAGSFETLAAALGAAELVDALKGDGPFTVFAPTDDAFAKLPKDVLASLLEPENKDRLVAVLTYHVVAGRVDAKGAIAAERAKTLQGEEVGIRIADGRLKVNDSNVVTNDIACSNGVIHVIDAVLLPPSVANPRGRKVIGVYVERPDAALAAQLGIDRAGALLVTSVSKSGNARAAGLQKYDVLTKIGSRPATSKNLDVAKNEAGVGGRIPFELLRKGHPVRLEIEVGFEAH